MKLTKVLNHLLKHKNNIKDDVKSVLHTGMLITKGDPQI